MKTTRLARRLLAVAAAVALAGSAHATVPPTPEQRASDLVARMSLEEKVAQLQSAAPALPRLGIPAYEWWNEGLHGAARAGYATVFPQAIGLAASWHPELMRQVGDVVSQEARARSKQVNTTCTWAVADPAMRRESMSPSASKGSKACRDEYHPASIHCSGTSTSFA